MHSLAAFFRKENVIRITYLVVGIIVAVQHYVAGPSGYNNFLIFRNSFPHLLEKVNLYLEYPGLYSDIFLYHPSFCVLFSPFNLLPVPAGLMLWTAGCSVLYFYAVRSLPLQHGHKVFIWWFVLFELITSLHSQQTNPIVAALGLLTFSSLEKGKIRAAALFPILAFCIKGYGLIFAALAIFYPQKKAFIRWSLCWLCLLTLLPLPFTGFSYFGQVYHDWYQCLLGDHEVNYGLSVMGLLKLIRPGFTPSDVALVQYLGLLLFGATWLWACLRNVADTAGYRFLLTAYASLWVILFNHAAESPTYIIAVQGVALWYVAAGCRIRYLGAAMIVLVFLFTILAPSDVYPLTWRQAFFRPFLIKVIPCFLTWSILQFQLFTLEKIQYGR